jgi:hypothetical protein
MRSIRIVRAAVAVVLIGAVSTTAGSTQAQTLATREVARSVERALLRLPYYGVFDFLAFGVDRGVVTVEGFAYRQALRSDAASAIKRVAGVDEISNKIEVLPASQEDDRIRWAIFYKIYTDDFLSRYAPGGAMSVRYELLTFSRFPDMQPFGNYPIHVIVKRGRVMLLGVVDNDADKTLAGVRAREVPRTFEVSNELVVDKR